MESSQGKSDFSQAEKVIERICDDETLKLIEGKMERGVVEMGDVRQLVDCVRAMRVASFAFIEALNHSNADRMQLEELVKGANNGQSYLI